MCNLPTTQMLMSVQGIPMAVLTMLSVLTQKEATLVYVDMVTVETAQFAEVCNSRSSTAGNTVLLAKCRDWV